MQLRREAPRFCSLNVGENDPVGVRLVQPFGRLVTSLFRETEIIRNRKINRTAHECRTREDGGLCKRVLSAGQTGDPDK